MKENGKHLGQPGKSAEIFIEFFFSIKKGKGFFLQRRGSSLPRVINSELSTG